MNRADITELHYIAPIENVLSILQYGILSNRRAARLPHRSVAMQEIQERRQDKLIPNARQLHEYVNLYFDAHNLMLSKCRAHNNSICVLRVNHTVVDLSGVIVTDKNAAKDYVRFYAAPQDCRRSTRIWSLRSSGSTGMILLMSNIVEE